MSEESFVNPAATVDLLVEKEGKILLIERLRNPFKGYWALPGGYLDCGKENLEEAAVRELEEETSLVTRVEDLELVGVYSDPERDPRGHVISHVYFAKKYSGKLKAADDAKSAKYFSFDELPQLAFDHNKIIGDYLRRENEFY